jgi:hypothetical protein
MASAARSLEPAVRLAVVLCLAVDAWVHLRLAPDQQVAAPDGLGGGTLFRLQAATAVLAAVFLLVTGRRVAYLVAGLVALSAFGAVLLYSLVEVPPLGAIPSMYDPTWSTDKVVSAAAEGLGVALAAVGAVLTSPGPGESRATSQGARDRVAGP